MRALKRRAHWLAFETRPQKDLITAYEKTARLFKARFKQSYSSCSCEKQVFKGKFSSVLSLPTKDATQINDVLNVIRGTEGQESGSRALQTINQATHPCAHCMILHVGNKMKYKGNVSTNGHNDDLHDPSPEWQMMLKQESLYGYRTPVLL